MREAQDLSCLDPAFSRRMTIIYHVWIQLFTQDDRRCANSYLHYPVPNYSPSGTYWVSAYNLRLGDLTLSFGGSTAALGP